MSDFEYLSVLIAIIVGIGFTHLLLSIGRLIGETKQLNVGVVQLIWTANILLMLTGFWWWALSLRQLEEWTFLSLVLILFDISLWCLLAAILYPVNIPPGYDLSAHFERKRTGFFAILILLSIADPFTATILGAEHLFELGWAYLHWMLVTLVGGILAIRYSAAWFQKGFAVYWGIALMLFNLHWQYSVTT